MDVLVIALALLPVSVFLLVLVLLDSFKLVSTRMLGRGLLAGALAALLAVFLHEWLLDRATVGAYALTRYIAPLTEETLKALLLISFIRRRHVGFLVDAAIVGFAAGAGFALVENLHYLSALADRNVWLWSVRGFGTAILHGTTTAIVSITAKSVADRRPRPGFLAILPGWAVAVVLHAAYNQTLLSPVLQAAMLMAVLPVAMLIVFERSERATREWVGAGLDLDVALLNLVLSREFDHTSLGTYLRKLKTRFPGPVVADMFCLLRLQLELAIRAKGLLMAREAGLPVPVDEDLRARLREERYLRQSIGSTGLVALRPLQVLSERDRWHRYLLEQAGARPQESLVRRLCSPRFR